MLDKIIESVQSLPPLPGAVQRLLGMANDPNTNFKDMARVISKDEALTARVLQIANSAFYGLSHKVTTTQQAMVVLGVNGVKNLALGAAVFGYSAKKIKNPPLDREAFWRHSLAVACASGLVASRLRLAKADEVFVGGLLHDIGKVVMMEVFIDEYRQVMALADKRNCPVHTAEKEIFGLTHAVVGEELCKQWKIPHELTHAIGTHHRAFKMPQGGEPAEGMTAAVQIADELSKLTDEGYSGDSIVKGEYVDELARSSASAEHIRQILMVVPDVVGKVASFFKLKSKKPAVDRIHSLRQPAVGLFIDDMRMGQLVHMSLQAMGFVVIHAADLKDAGQSLDAVIHAMGRLPDDVKTHCFNEDKPMLNYTFWERRNNRAPDGMLNTRQFRQWICDELKGRDFGDLACAG
jgi:putative nucleotidyltransferase with HDIG domain